MSDRLRRLHRWGQYELARPRARVIGVVLAGWGLAALAVAYTVALWRMPSWMGVSEPKDRHNARLLVVSAGGAVVVAISLLYTARSYRGQVTDRFTKALERLGSTDMDARLGGIHALAHVAADSRAHHDDVVEVLEAFLRRRAPAARPDEGSPSLAPRPPLPERPAADVQATLTALGTRPRRPERRVLDLSGLHLRRARLASADLHAASLRGADLVQADLRGVDLGHADLQNADMRDAQMRGARLPGATLKDVCLRGADCSRARTWRSDRLVGVQQPRARPPMVSRGGYRSRSPSFHRSVSPLGVVHEQGPAGVDGQAHRHAAVRRCGA
ncbi:pentapeptide repeat-containing protein [Actinomadura macra]|uniref:pentapeptide repeat-containing protein n=1 Tax=Actinomadura macra TaxID=46164 RepID=UPI00082F8697|nr:pentapeptide repeat-containing protein [Actinomadura macra]